jgi:hypothetical protein
MVNLQTVSDTFDRTFVNDLAVLVHTPPEQLRLIIVFVLMYPIGWFIHYAVHGRVARHVFCTIVGIMWQLIMYRSAIIEICIMGYGAYFLMILLPKRIQAKYVTYFCLGMLSYQHIMTYWYDPNSEQYEMGVVCYTMLLCCKMQALGYNYADGQEYVYKMETEPGKKEVY